MNPPQNIVMGDQPNTCPTCGARTATLRTETGPDGWEFLVEQCTNARCAEIHHFHHDHDEDDEG